MGLSKDEIQYKISVIEDETRAGYNTKIRVGDVLTDLNDSNTAWYDVISGATSGQTSFPIEGSDELLYIDKTHNTIYTWNASSNKYVQISGNGTSSGGTANFTLTTNGASGASTFNEGILNIPRYDNNDKINLSLYKSGSNGIVYPTIFKWDSDLLLTNVVFMSNCTEVSLSIGSTPYSGSTLSNITLPSNTELLINDLTINAGKTVANAILKLIRI